MAFGDCRGLSAEPAGGSVAGARGEGREGEGCRGGGLGAPAACEERRPARSSGGRAWNDQPSSVWKAQGCPHCAAREVVGWGRSHGLLRFRCKSCGRTFNALTRTPMAHLRKKERWLDHARAMIEGKSLAKTAALCGVHPTTAFRWRHRFLRAPASDKPRGLRGIVEADETFILEHLQGPLVRLCRARLSKRGGTARHAGLYQDNIPVLVARDRNGATFDAILPQVDGASVEAAPSPASSRRAIISSAMAGKAIAAFARRARESDYHAVPAPGKADPRGAAPAHQQRQRLPRPP